VVESELDCVAVCLAGMIKKVLNNLMVLGYNEIMKTFTLDFFRKAGKVGGSSKSKAKAAAARKNGLKGGRPKEKRKS
jgi:hypothetical protein